MAERMRRLLPTPGGRFAGRSVTTPRAPAGPVVNPALADLMGRVARLRASAPRRAVVLADTGIAAAWGGRVLADGLVAVDRRYPLWHRQGAVPLSRLAGLAQDDHGCLRWPQRIDPARLVFIDTETTGLAGGSGTLAFMIGIGRLDGPVLAVTQYVLTRFAGEAAMLDRLTADIGGEATLVSYNGKSFDLPLLASRYRMSGRTAALDKAPHIDLLHAMRRRHGAQLPDCRLATAESAVLRFERRDDLPGAEAPRAWQQLLRGDASGMAGVLRHNRDDIVSMAALLPLLAKAGAALCQT